MSTIERLNNLRQKLGLHLIMPHDRHDRMHEKLDECDRCAGIITRHGRYSLYNGPARMAPTQEYVGARLARLERHVNGSAVPHFFHLGAEAA